MTETLDDIIADAAPRVDTLAMCDQCCHMVPKSELLSCRRIWNSTNWHYQVDGRQYHRLCPQCAFAARLEGRL